MNTVSLISDLENMEERDKMCQIWANEIRKGTESIVSVIILATEYIEKQGGKWKMGRVLDIVEEVSRNAVVFYEPKEARQIVEALIDASKGKLKINVGSKKSCCTII